MSQSSSKIIIRQWKIIQFLLNQGYVTTTEIEEYLYQQGIETTQRTIQRDLNLLEKIFPLECRRDCMPHNWRWKKTETTIKGLSLSQAVILHLVNKELRDVLPQHILTELNPLFEKAKLITANKTMQNPEKSILDIFNSDDHLGAMRPSIVGQLINHIGDSVNEMYRDVLNLDEKEAQPVLQQLAVILETNELPELAQALKQQK
ncbi:DeoR family transcriptional regulator [Acinetobacter junii]|uniref:DeoR family transcriptional regulator n=1 Tax=Acinetobacter junii TaxID=40215 RepID=UPI00124CF960|nr:DeoR family transcriptional regulator [Acinetobacter junii]